MSAQKGKKVMKKQTEVVETTIEKNVVTTKKAAVTKKEKKSGEGQVVSEFTHQMTTFGEFIYNVENQGADITVENLGYGDVYVSDTPKILMGQAEQRIIFRKSKTFTGVNKLFFFSASQPVISIIEVKHV